MTKPDIFVITGTRGSGRKTIAHKIAGEFGLIHVVSCTTRPPRTKEIADQDYHYVSREAFAEAENKEEFMQTVEIDGERYGIRKRELEIALSGNKPIYLILNREGASMIKQLYGDRVVRLFLYVGKQTLKERLEAKGTKYDLVESYLDSYTEEVLYRKKCEHVFENVELNRTLELIRQTVRNYL